jgi:hypothetical protein
MNDKKPDFVSFAKAIMMDQRDGYGIGFCDLQHLALKHGLLRIIPGGFDPKKHTNTFGFAEPGDEWCELNFDRETQND